MIEQIEEIRLKGKKAIGTVIKKENNIIIFEKWIYKMSVKEDQDFINNSREYIKNIFQIVQDLKNGKDRNEVLNNIKKKKIGWNHECFNEIRIVLEEQDNFVMNPFEIEEGALECRCGSKRVFSYSKQTRSCDEPMTTFAQCMSCKLKWKYSG